MFKSCPECGNVLPSSAKFCPECGHKLTRFLKYKAEKKDAVHTRELNISELGEKLEEAVEMIFQARGFKTFRRRRLKGKSGTINEIDVLAKKGDKVIAVECKNLATAIGQDHVRNFCFKLNELNIKKGYFASNSEFTSGARQLAQQRNITLWTRENLMEMIYAVTIGRYKLGQKIQFKRALPCKVDFDLAIQLNLENKEKVNILESELVYHPYFSVEYLYKAIYHDPSRKVHKFSDEGTVFIDAIDGKVVNFKGVTSKILAKVFLKREETVRSEVLNELRFYEKATNYSVVVNNNFQINKMEPEITVRFAKKLALDFIIQKNTKSVSYSPKTGSLLETKWVTFKPKRKQVMIKKIVFFYVPKWNITFSCKDIDYSRKMFAYSGNLIEDTIAFCPEHFSLGNIQLISKRSIAVCEVCGKALCEDHVKKCPVCGKWLCYKHGVKCNVCGNLFCSEHAATICEICGNIICDSCATQCPICNKTYGKPHEVTCDDCGAIVCSSCIVTEGLLRRKHYCIKCKAK